jgi:hypothetical protein
MIHKLLIFDIYLRQLVTLALRGKGGMPDGYKVPPPVELR